MKILYYRKYKCIYPSVVNTICISSFRYTHVIISRKISIKIGVATDEGNSRNEM